jgi:rhodanese-related sulfurtransferase
VQRLTIDHLLYAARARLIRVSTASVLAAIDTGARLVDIRSDCQIARDGRIPGALVIARNTLEWRLDPASPFRHPKAPGICDHVILVCNDGYQSSLAAATLQLLGFSRATDLDGGFVAWRAAGLPFEPPQEGSMVAAGDCAEDPPDRS